MDDIKRQPSRNRIEEALKGKPAYEPASYIPPIPSKHVPEEPAPVTEPPKHIQKRNYLRVLKLGLFVVAIAVLLAFVGWGGYETFKSLEETKNPAPQEIIARVGKLVTLPDETPTVATVTDLAPLAGQVFFKDAAVGDKVLMFSRSKKAILYRPSTDRIILTAPFGDE